MKANAKFPLAGGRLGVVACVLTGGLSSRMGRDKARIRLAGLALSTHACRRAREAGLVAFTVRTDHVERCGPLGGMLTAFERRPRADAIVFLACDMPWVPPALLQRLLHEHEGTGRGIFTKHGKRVGFPLILGREVIPLLKQSLQARTLSLQAFAKAIKARGVTAAALERKALANFNTPESLRAAKSSDQ